MFVLPFLQASSAAEIEVRWSRDASPPRVEVLGVDPGNLAALKQAQWSTAQWQELLPVYAEPPAGIAVLVELPAMLGRYSVEDDRIRFEPRFPLEPGLDYRAIFRPGRLPKGEGRGDSISASYTPPAVTREPSTRITAVYPSGPEVPENLLKFYIHFSAPMSRGGIYDFIRLENERGEAIELPFLEIDEELWNQEMTRLTLFIDPGRIKRGVKPLEEIGPALEAGRKFTLVIDRGWEDAQGVPLISSFKKTFAVTSPDRAPPDPARWHIEPPKAGTRDPLRVVFPEPMEHALALRLIWVTHGKEQIIQGEARLEQGEKVWLLEPREKWQAGPYFLAVQNTIEDLAGNNIGKPFEVDLFKEVKRLRPEIITRPFQVQ